VPLLKISTAFSFIHRRKKLDATAMVAFVARGSEPSAGEAERSGEGRFGGFPPTTIKQFASAAAATSTINVSPL
jgi:hypothetical protein